jgi:outer membrane protein assembly factor BamB
VHHRHGTAETVTFDLVPDDDGPVPDDAGVPSDPGEPPPSVVGRLRTAVAAWPRRRKIVAVASAAGLVLASVGVVVAVDGVRDRQLRHQLVEAPGGVFSLARPPEQRWRAPLAGQEVVALMDGLLVVADRQYWSEDTDDPSVTLTAVDPADGSVRWSTEVEGADWCGGAPPPPAGMWGGGVSEATALVCATVEPEPGVAVVGEDGRITARRALDDPVEGEVVLAAPGAVVRLARVGTPDEGVVVDWTLGEDFATRDLTVRLEDAVTGDVRWETTLDGGTAPAGTRVDSIFQCADGGPDGTSFESVSDDISGYAWEVGARALWVGACGVDATIDLVTGEVVRSTDPFDAAGDWYQGVVSLDGGGYATRVPAESSSDAPLLGEVNRIWRADGTVVGDVPGSVAVPTATDGSPADVLLTTGADGLSAFDPADTTPLWVRRGTATPLARTERVLVVGQGTGIVGLDPRTGRELWTRPPPEPGQGPGELPSQVVRAFTDGRYVMLMGLRDAGLVGEDGTADLSLVALDLATGATVWTAERTAPFLQSIAGQLYEVRSDALVALE